MKDKLDKIFRRRGVKSRKILILQTKKKNLKKKKNNRTFQVWDRDRKITNGSDKCVWLI